MELSFTQKKSVRKNFGKLQESLSIPNLIEVQKNSFNEFVKKSDENKKSIYKKGLTKVFESISAHNAAIVIGLPRIEPELSINKVTMVSLKS